MIPCCWIHLVFIKLPQLLVMQWFTLPDWCLNYFCNLSSYKCWNCVHQFQLCRSNIFSIHVYWINVVFHSKSCVYVCAVVRFRQEKIRHFAAYRSFSAFCSKKCLVTVLNQSLNRKSCRKFALLCFRVTCFKHVGLL